MRTLGEQWVENGRMLKAMPNQMDKYSKHMGGSICHGCSFVDSMDDDCTLPDPPCKRCINKPIIRDLGPVNEDGCLAEERTGKFPKVSQVFDNLWKAFIYVNNDLEHIEVAVYGKTKQEAIEAWNRRA